MANNPPRRIDIKGQDHMLAYITPEEGGILQLLGGSGAPGPMGIPSFFDAGPGDTSSDGVDGPSGEADGGASSSGNANDPSEGGTESPSVGGSPGYSGTTISDAMAASSPTGMTGTGGIGGGFGVFGGTGMGMEDMSIADQVGMMSGYAGIPGSGLATGVKGLGTMQGSVNYAPVKANKYLPSFVRDAMNKHARDSLSRGYSPEFSVDPDTGNITSVTGKGGASGMPGIGGLMSMIGANMGAVTTTGYAGKGVDDTDIGGGENDAQDIVKDARTFLGEDIAEIDDKVVGESFIDPLLLKYLKGQRGTLPTLEVGYGQDIVGSSSVKPVDFSAIDRGLQRTQSGIESINRNRY